MAQPIQDGVYLTYIKDGTIYPVSISMEQHAMVQALVGGICKPLVVMFDHPQGKASNLLDVLPKKKELLN